MSFSCHVFLLSKFCSVLYVFSWVVQLKQNDIPLSVINSSIFNILGQYLNVFMARKTGSGWVDPFACLFISYYIFKLSSTQLKKELKVSASSSFLIIISTVSLLIFVMDSFWNAFSENSVFNVFQNFLLSFKILLSSKAK